MKFAYSKIWIVVSLLSKLHLSQSTHDRRLAPSATADSMASPALDNYDNNYQQIPQTPRTPRVPKSSQEHQLPQTPQEPINQSSCADSCSGVTYIPCMASCGFSDYVSLDRLIKGGGLEALMNKVFGNETSIDAPGYTSPPKQRQLDTISTGTNTLETVTYPRNKPTGYSKSIHPMKLTPTPLNPYDITTRTDLSQITVETYDLSSATGHSSGSISTTPTGTTGATTSGTSLASTTTDSALSATQTSKTAITVTETTKATTSGQKTTTLASGSLSLYSQNTNSIRVSSTYLIFAVSILIVNL